VRCLCRIFDSDSMMLKTGSTFEPPHALGGMNINQAGYVEGTHQRVVEMKDSSAFVKSGDWSKLWERFYLDRYLLIRGAINQSDIVKARASIDNCLECVEFISPDGKLRQKSQGGMTVDVATGNIIPSTSEHILEEKPGIKANILDFKETLLKDFFMTKEVRSVFDHPAIERVMSMIAKGMQARYEDQKFDVTPYLLDPYASWLRVKAPQESSNLHSDVFYFKVS
jgi:hypothetical protein